MDVKMYEWLEAAFTFDRYTTGEIVYIASCLAIWVIAMVNISEYQRRSRMTKEQREAEDRQNDADMQNY